MNIQITEKMLSDLEEALVRKRTYDNGVGDDAIDVLYGYARANLMKGMSLITSEIHVYASLTFYRYRCGEDGKFNKHGSKLRSYAMVQLSPQYSIEFFPNYIELCFDNFTDDVGSHQTIVMHEDVSGSKAVEEFITASMVEHL